MSPAPTAETPAMTGDASQRHADLTLRAAYGLFVAGFFFAMSPNLVFLYGVHNDYEMLIFKSNGLLHHEAEHLFSIARPLAALFANITLLPVSGFDDYRWTRLFSTLSVCLLGCQMIAICVHRLKVGVLEALAVSLTTFLVPAFVYSVLNAPAWGTHLVPIFFAFVAYGILSRANVLAFPFLGIVERRDAIGFWRQTIAYARLREVWVSSLVLQIAFLDFPPNALILVIFPVVTLLFSQTPAAYRALVALRDLAFVVLNTILYTVLAKLFLIPIARFLIFRNSEEWRSTGLSDFDRRLAGSYDFKFTADFGEVFSRLERLARVSSDLWFMPQASFHVAAAAVILAGALVVAARSMSAPANARRTLVFGAAKIAVVFCCFLLAGSAVLAAGGGFVSYRTIPVATAVVAVTFVASVQSVAGLMGKFAFSAALLFPVAAAIAGNFELNYLTMKLARNETAYFQSLITKALEKQTNVLFIIDPRPFSLPEDNPIMVDRGGRAAPPYELGCLSSVCLQNGAIATILAERRGIPRGQLRVFPIRGAEPVAGVTCELLEAPQLVVPAGASERAVGTIKYWRNLAPFTCVPFSLAWHDLAR